MPAFHLHGSALGSRHVAHALELCELVFLVLQQHWLVGLALGKSSELQRVVLKPLVINCALHVVSVVGNALHAGFNAYELEVLYDVLHAVRHAVGLPVFRRDAIPLSDEVDVGVVDEQGVVNADVLDGVLLGHKQHRSKQYTLKNALEGNYLCTYLHELIVVMNPAEMGSTGLVAEVEVGVATTELLKFDYYDSRWFGWLCFLLILSEYHIIGSLIESHNL